MSGQVTFFNVNIKITCFIPESLYCLNGIFPCFFQSVIQVFVNIQIAKFWIRIAQNLHSRKFCKPYFCNEALSQRRGKGRRRCEVRGWGCCSWA